MHVTHFQALTARPLIKLSHSDLYPHTTLNAMEVAYTARGYLPPLCAAMGGIVAQEACGRPAYAPLHAGHTPAHYVQYSSVMLVWMRCCCHGGYACFVQRARISLNTCGKVPSRHQHHSCRIYLLSIRACCSPSPVLLTGVLPLICMMIGRWSTLLLTEVRNTPELLCV